MYISNKVIFIELHKTASTHIKKILLETQEGKSIGKHNQLTPELASREVIFLGSVRNPYDWYLSLWGYGCDSKGAVFSSVTRESGWSIRGLGWRTRPDRAAFGALHQAFSRKKLAKKSKEWKASYADVNDPVLFRNWLRMINDPDYMNDVGEGYSFWPGSKIAGLMTFRYLKLFCVTTAENAKIGTLNSLDRIIEFESKNLKINRFIRQESLQPDMSDLLEKIGLTNSLNVKDLLSFRSNTSSRSREMSFYYDQESIELVARREKMIIEKFGYGFPK